jgi:hypothetical protein
MSRSITLLHSEPSVAYYRVTFTFIRFGKNSVQNTGTAKGALCLPAATNYRPRSAFSTKDQRGQQSAGVGFVGVGVTDVVLCLRTSDSFCLYSDLDNIHYIEMSGQHHATAALLPDTELPLNAK